MIVLEILPNDVYFENEKKDSTYISFNKARTIIFKDLPKIIKYSCVDSKRSVDFLNLLLTKYFIYNEEYLKLKII
ncbi:hypothetical protein [Arcobacter sp. F2176]|uniref:hypothetical protein n=1 Tax=Arcobacter sp. F2176 TaxID=2044511 RepID=UPI00100A5B19|nr:hypothetical protein [Arcobacter sp. F2176]RXJ82163.1 hypothetical protein CRU95_04560 [Arcobacter sp. F2176]